MAGRRPKPTRLKLITGNPGRRPLNQSEPEPERGIPTMPNWLKEFPIAISEWERESKILDDMGILTMAECSILATRCYLASEIQTMALEIEKEGRVAYTSRMDSQGNEIMDAKANPKCVQIKNLITEHRAMGSLLGLDPSSRSKLKTEIKKPKSKVELFMGRKNGAG